MLRNIPEARGEEQCITNCNPVKMILTALHGGEDFYCLSVAPVLQRKSSLFKLKQEKLWLKTVALLCGLIGAETVRRIL